MFTYWLSGLIWWRWYSVYKSIIYRIQWQVITHLEIKDKISWYSTGNF